MVHARAGQRALPSDLVDVPALISAYYTERPDPGVRAELVSFGTSGHRGSSLQRSFNDLHIAAIAQAICEHRATASITGPLYLGADTHALSTPAQLSAIEVFVANGVDVRWAPGAFTPTPAVSRAVLEHNADASARRADGVVITPSHNPPSDGGFKYDPPHGGPAGGAITTAIQTRANALLAEPSAIRRVPLAKARQSDHLHAFDFVTPYVEALAQVIDMQRIADAKLRLGADPMGGSGVAYWAPIAERYGLDIEVVNGAVDPTFRFMTLDHDGKIRMDCSSRHAMASLVELRSRFDVAFGNDTDFDRHGIVTPKHGLLNPNHYLAVAIDHLFRTRPWPGAAVGKTLVTSAIVDRVAADLDRPLHETPVGFKHFVEGLQDGTLGFGGEESAGASFLKRDGTVWTTDKDGILLDLLAAEITAVHGDDLGDRYAALTERFGAPVYERTEAPATPDDKAKLKALGPEQVLATELAGDPITQKLTRAPGNGAALGGLKVQTEHGWFAARPSGTEAVYKIYAESFRGEDHLRAIQEEAQAIVAKALA